MRASWGIAVYGLEQLPLVDLQHDAFLGGLGVKRIGTIQKGDRLTEGLAGVGQVHDLFAPLRRRDRQFDLAHHHQVHAQVQVALQEQHLVLVEPIFPGGLGDLLQFGIAQPPEQGLLRQDLSDGMSYLQHHCMAISIIWHIVF